MKLQTHIVSFDDARHFARQLGSMPYGQDDDVIDESNRVERSSRSTVRGAAHGTVRANVRPSVYTKHSNSYAAFGNDSQRVSVYADRRNRYYPSSQDRSRTSIQDRNMPKRSSAYDRDAYKRDAYDRDAYERDAYDRDAYERDAYEESSSENQSGHGASSVKTKLAKRFEQIRREHTKKKADRRFSNQYDTSDGADASIPDRAAPRAAVYVGEMGHTQRRSARMQRSSSKSARSSGRHALGSTDGGDEPFSKRRRFPTRMQLACLSIVAVLVLGCAALYAPARQYYQEVRERDRLQAEYDAVQARNDAIQNQIDVLSTDEGVEDKARAELGWVMEGETAGMVSGLDTEDASAAVAANIPTGSVEAPETWYSVILDPLFGVE